MVMITRHDGVNFISQAYREPLILEKKNLLVQEIRMLADQHGQYVCPMRRMRRELEVAFSKEPGYLLGETVWDFFGRPDNLIYCESIAESANCLLVIVQSGRVYFDRKVVSSEVQAELSPILTGSRIYDVFTYGDVPIRNVETFGGATFTMPKKMLARFEHLNEPVFPRLVPSRSYALRPLPDILKLRYLHSRNQMLFTAVLLVILIAGSWWLLMPSHVTTMQLSSAVTAEQVVTEGSTTLSAPNPAQVLSEFSSHVEQLYLIPGWQTNRIQYLNGAYTAQLQSNHGSLGFLSSWAKQHGYHFQLTPSGVQLHWVSTLPKQKSAIKMQSMQTDLDTLIDRMHHILPGDAIHLDANKQNGSLREATLRIYLKEISPSLLDLIGAEFDDVPVSLSSMNIDLKDGLINGTLSVSVWGK